MFTQRTIQGCMATAASVSTCGSLNGPERSNYVPWRNEALASFGGTAGHDHIATSCSAQMARLSSLLSGSSSSVQRA